MDFRTLITDAAIEAGSIIKNLKNSHSSREKTPGNLVTEADLLAEKTIIEKLKSATPEISILSEETLNTTAVSSEWLWIIDPLDGTNNFAHTIPHYCVSIALAHNGEPFCGIVHDPERNETYWAKKNEGAFCNNQKIAVSSRNSLNESIIATGFYYDRGHIMEKTLESIHTLFKTNIQGIRRAGSAALDCCWVAHGRYDGYFEYMLNPWDYAAGMLIIQEAGGMCSDRIGGPLRFDTTGIIVSNGIIHDPLVKLVSYTGN